MATTSASVIPSSKRPRLFTARGKSPEASCPWRWLGSRGGCGKSPLLGGARICRHLDHVLPACGTGTGGRACVLSDTLHSIIPDACRAGLAFFAVRMASRRCFLTAIAVLAPSVLLFAMTAGSGSSAQAADALLIDTDTNVAFRNVSGVMDVGTTPDGRAWFRAAAAVQFAMGSAARGLLRSFYRSRSTRRIVCPTVSAGACGRWAMQDAKGALDRSPSISHPCVTW
jgi:hypothetical protein